MNKLVDRPTGSDPRQARAVFPREPVDLDAPHWTDDRSMRSGRKPGTALLSPPNAEKSMMRPSTVIGGIVGTVALTAGLLWALSSGAGDTTTLQSGELDNNPTTSVAAPATDQAANPAPAAPGSEASPAPAAPAPAAQVAPSTLGDQPLTLRGMGELQTGMTVAEAEQALGGTIIEDPNFIDQCRVGRLAGDSNSPWLMILTEAGDFSSGIITRIDITENSRTLSGIGFGSTKADVLSTYGDRIVVGPHKFDPAPGSEYLTYVPTDPADANHRLIIETYDDRVVAVRSGLLPSVEWVEGCL